MEGAVLVEVWMEERSIPAWLNGVRCRDVRLHARPDGTFDLSIDTKMSDAKVAGFVAVSESRHVEAEVAETFGGQAEV